MFLTQWLCFCAILGGSCYGQEEPFRVPQVFLLAFDPAGFKAAIKVQAGIEQFAFHGKINQPIYPTEPGDFGEDITIPGNDGYFTYFNPTLTLNPGDVVNYWVFVQHNQLGYRKDLQQWKVTELISASNCTKTVMQTDDRLEICSKSTIFLDEFETFDRNKWTWEQYIPEGPDYEFVVYKKDPTVLFVDDGKLKIRPKILSEQEINMDVVDVTDGCTRTKPTLCRFKKFLLNNPIASGRLVTKNSFTYSEVEVNARLPTGDWIYPEIYLEEDTTAQEFRKKIWIAYARGNKELTGNDNIDIGGTLLFGGPVLDPSEPGRSSKLSSFRSSEGPLSNGFHKYKIRWTPDQIKLFIDGKVYGIIDSTTLASSGFIGDTPTKVRLVLGVGVGGINDFPNDYNSGVHTKPWKNRNREQLKMFYSKKNDWYPTWTDDGQMIVEYVTITAI